jgi:hypothetical protein
MPDRRWHLRVGWIAAVLVVALAACEPSPPDRRTDVDRLVAQIRTLPGVAAASHGFADRPAQGLVYFRIRVDVADDLTADQLAAITNRYLQNLHTPDYEGYQAELDARHGWNVFAVDSGQLPITNGDQVVSQARDWVAMRHAFPGATVSLRATITHPAGQLPIQEWGHSNVGIIDLPDPADYTVVSAAVSTLAARFSQLGGLDWTISAGKEHPADIKTSRRLPTAKELGVWDSLNADQSIPHVDKMRINGPATPAVWVSEKTTRSRELSVAVQLARQHLPVVATLSPPVLYTASDEISGHIGAQGHARGPVAITIGGCTARELWVYQPSTSEQKLINRYEKCQH